MSTIVDRLSRLVWTGATGPLQPKSSKMTIVLLIATCCVFATTNGYDSGLMNGINMMPQYTTWFQLTTVTKSLNTCATYIGWFIAAFLMAPVVERCGRKGGVVVSIVLKIIGIAIMTSSSSVPMFVIGRIILGWAKGTSAIASSTWLAETLPASIRGRGLSITFSVFFAGALLASGVCVGTAGIAGNWSWRVPCLLMVVFSLVCLVVLFATPESPRWLIYHDRHDEALAALASLHTDDGDVTAEAVRIEYASLMARLHAERDEKSVGFREMVRTPNARRRLLLAVSVGVISMLAGNNIVSYYLGDMLAQAGIYDDAVKLQINVVLNAWSLVCALSGTACMDRVGRKVMCLAACVGTAVAMVLVGVMTKFFGSGENLSGAYGTVAMIFLFQGAYSFGITPITTLYPPEVLNYSIRASGMAAWGFAVNICGLFSTFVMPIALAAIGWRLYMVNGAWDVLQAVFVAVFWVETKGLSLEEIDRLIEKEGGTTSVARDDEKGDGLYGDVVIEGKEEKAVVEVEPVEKKD